MGPNPVHKETPEVLVTGRGHGETTATCKLRREASEEDTPAGPLTLALEPTEL